MNGRAWSTDEMVIVRKLYSLVGPRPPGGHGNVLIRIIAEKLNRGANTIYKRLHNYAARDPQSPVRGLPGGGDYVADYFLMPATNPERYEQILKACRRKYGLWGVI